MSAVSPAIARFLLASTLAAMAGSCGSVVAEAPDARGSDGAAPDLRDPAAVPAERALRAIVAADPEARRREVAPSRGPLLTEPEFSTAQRLGAAALCAVANLPPPRARRRAPRPDQPLDLASLVRAQGLDTPLGLGLTVGTRQLLLERRTEGGWEALAAWRNAPDPRDDRGLARFAGVVEWLIVDRELRVVHEELPGMRRAWWSEAEPTLAMAMGPARLPLRLWPEDADLDAVPFGLGLDCDVVFGGGVQACSESVDFRFRFEPRSLERARAELALLARSQLAAQGLERPADVADYVPWFYSEGQRVAAFHVRKGRGPRAAHVVRARLGGRQFHVPGDYANGTVGNDGTRATLDFLARLAPDRAAEQARILAAASAHGVALVRSTGALAQAECTERRCGHQEHGAPALAEVAPEPDAVLAASR